MYRVITLQCLTEISTIQIDTQDQGYQQKLRSMFAATIKEVTLFSSPQIGRDKDFFNPSLQALSLLNVTIMKQLTFQ